MLLPSWVYLHFFDRELLTACGVYQMLSQRRLDDDFRVALAAVDEPAYVSQSVLFESDYAYHIFFRDEILLTRPDILRVATSYPSLASFMNAKQNSYRRFEERYKRYFDDTWKRLEDSAPTFIIKHSNTTEVLHKHFASKPSNFGDKHSLGTTDGEASGVVFQDEATPVITAFIEPMLQKTLDSEEARIFIVLRCGGNFTRH